MPRNSVLLSTGHVSLGLSQCGEVLSTSSKEEMESHFTLVFPISGVFGVQVEGLRTSATPAKAVLFNRGQLRRVHHPHGGLDRSVFISMASGFAEPFLSRSGKFQVESANTTPRLDYRLRCLVAAAKLAHLEALEVEEFTARALAALMGVGESSPTGRRRNFVFDAEEYLSLNFRERCDLPAVARHVGYSGHHLSRSFKAVTGESLSHRRMRLRLSSALSQILDGASDLARVAVESGFFDHSHMTNSFRSHYGVAPGEVRLRGGLAERIY